MAQSRRDYEEKLLQRIIETDGIKKIQDPITAVISGTPRIDVRTGSILVKSMVGTARISSGSVGIKGTPRVRLLGTPRVTVFSGSVGIGAMAGTVKVTSSVGTVKISSGSVGIKGTPSIRVLGTVATTAGSLSIKGTPRVVNWGGSVRVTSMVGTVKVGGMTGTVKLSGTPRIDVRTGSIRVKSMVGTARITNPLGTVKITGGRIGTVDYMPPSILRVGTKTVTYSGTPEPLVATSTVVKNSVLIQARSGNTDTVYIGGSPPLLRPIELEPMDAVVVVVRNLGSVYVKVDVNGEGVNYIGS